VNVEKEPNLYVALTRAYIAGSPAVAHARGALESSTRRWIDLALGDGDFGDRDAIALILEAVIFANLVGLVTGGRAPEETAEELERAARTLLRENPTVVTPDALAGR
jgi:Tetracyclin repressor-like, C-terminal domain